MTLHTGPAGGGFDVEQVAAVADPVLRNLCITQAYSDFGHRFDDLVGPDATWCSFGVWASNTAGLSIRKTEIWPAVERLIDVEAAHHEARHLLNKELHALVERGVIAPLERTHVTAAFSAVLDRVSEQIAAGNVLVYAELAPLFARFLESFERSRPAQTERQTFLASIGVAEVDGSAPEPGLLVGAFGSYFDAAFRTGEQQALAVLAGNVQAVLHEQQRLQAAVRAALDAGAGVAEDVVHRAAAPGQKLARDLMGRLAPAVLARFAAELDRLWEEVATMLLMRLFTSDECLHLGYDVPAVPPGPLFPPALRRLSGDAAALFQRLDRTGGSGVGSRAADWGDLGERMNYIVNLFRSRQQHPPIRSEPFTPAQVADLRAYRMPAGPFIAG